MTDVMQIRVLISDKVPCKEISESDMDQKHRGNSSINPESTRTSYSRTSTASASIFGSEVFSISDLSTSCSAGMHSNEELLALSQR